MLSGPSGQNSELGGLGLLHTVPSYSEQTTVNLDAGSRGRCISVSNMPVFTLVYLRTCTHCNLQKKKK